MDEEQQRLIQTLAERVSQHGRKFEDLVQEKEKDNPQFAFLRDEQVSINTLQSHLQSWS